MGANTLTTSHLIDSTCNTKTLEIEFEDRSIKYRLSCQFLAPPSNEFIMHVLLRRDNVLLQRGPAERLTSKNVNKPMRTIMSEAYILFL